jgi:hypothetical protein
MGRNFAMFVRKMDVKYVRMKCNHGTKCLPVGLAKKAVDQMFTCDILLQKNVETEMFRGGRTIRPP